MMLWNALFCPVLKENKMHILGLTGSVGMGKSTVASLFRELKIPVYDADAEIHHLYQNSEICQALIVLFGNQIKNPDGSIDRSLLGKMVFQDRQKLRLLESVLHPKLRQRQDQFIRSHRLRKAPLIVLDIPLLYEVKKDKLVESVLVVSAPFWIQKKRVLQRPAMTEQKFHAILKRQVPDLLKRQRADHIIETYHGIKRARYDVLRLVEELKHHDSK